MTLDFAGLSRRFGEVLALDDLSFTVPAGEVVGFLGPNGSGKTTTMRAVFGLIALDSGSVRWNGNLVTAANRRRFGYMPEERGLYPGMVVAEQLQYLARLHGMTAPRPARPRPVAGAARPGRPGAQQGGVAVARQPAAGAAGRRAGARARLLVLDEPLAGLDPAASTPSARCWPSSARRAGACCSPATSSTWSRTCATSVAIIDHGRLVARGVEDLVTRGCRRLLVKVEETMPAPGPESCWAPGCRGWTAERCGSLSMTTPMRRSYWPRRCGPGRCCSSASNGAGCPRSFENR